MVQLGGYCSGAGARYKDYEKGCSGGGGAFWERCVGRGMKYVAVRGFVEVNEEGEEGDGEEIEWKSAGLGGLHG